MALLPHIHACLSIWLSKARPVVGVEEARRFVNVGPPGAPRCTTGLLRARDKGRMLKGNSLNITHETILNLHHINTGRGDIFRVLLKSVAIKTGS